MIFDAVNLGMSWGCGGGVAEDLGGGGGLGLGLG